MKTFSSSSRPVIREILVASPSRRLQVFVLFNGLQSTANALRTAARFLADLGGEVVIAAPQVVPYPLPIDRPPGNSSILISRIQGAVERAGIGSPVENVTIAYAREIKTGWKALLPAHCIVVVGRPSWLSPIQRITSWFNRRSLRQLGHEVVAS